MRGGRRAQASGQPLLPQRRAGGKQDAHRPHGHTQDVHTPHMTVFPRPPPTMCVCAHE
jgi:hypothetical protein